MSWQDVAVAVIVALAVLFLLRAMRPRRAASEKRGPDVPASGLVRKPKTSAAPSESEEHDAEREDR